MKDYFQALQSHEYEKLYELSTADYILFEQGLIWNNDSIINVFKKNAEVKYNYSLKEFNIKSDCNSAFVSYINYGVIERGDTTFKKNWTESASVRRVNGKLKLEFLHSSAMK